MKPIFRITADDKDISKLLAQRLISLNISDETGLVSDKTEILLDNRDNILDIPPRGTTLKIYLGYDEESLSLIGSFIVDNISLSSPPSKLRITAKANYSNNRNLSNKIRAPKSKSWHEYNLVSIISEIAAEHKFESLIDEYFNQIYIPHIDQTNESDLSFLVSLSQNYDALIKFINNKLVFARKSRGLSINDKELPTTQIFENQITNWQLDILDRGKFGKVIAKYHDFATGEEKQVSVGNDEPSYEIRFTFIDEQRALQAAKSKLAEFQRGITRLRIAVVGNSNFSAESKISIPNIRYLKNKNWIINSVNHELNDQGYKSTINAAEKT